ncbi:MAG: peptidoglycan bridge formation glycyltransferase FemA/FemB family protein [Treponema sp.]|nr:peptidoglycan bridge formation glycyltransferase FemA/FemB family protein [Treponema sp.]
MCNIKTADLAACENADSFLQSAIWGRFKSRFGWKANAYIVEWTESGSKPLLVLSRRIAPGIVMAYIPWGPELPAGFPAAPAARAEAAADLAHTLRPLLPRKTVFIRFDPPWFITEGDDNALLEIPAPLKRAAADIQPPDTVLIDLTPLPDEILAAMKPKWRYNIGLAAKRGVSVETTVGGSGQDKPIEVFYRLLSDTAGRDGIAIHHLGYYKTLFTEQGIEIRLYTAWHEGDAIAANVVLFRNRQATYLYGASANIKRNLMAPYALQWRAMLDAKALGCTEYDLFGIPPNDNPDHPMAGLYRFKTGFGGTIIHRPGSWDYPCKPVLYAMFSTAEKLRKKIRDKKKGRGKKSK